MVGLERYILLAFLFFTQYAYCTQTTYCKNYKTSDTQTSGLKTTLDWDENEMSAIPVVFHILINQEQLDALGGVDEIFSRAKTQIATLNSDFNAGDYDKVPPEFKPMVGKMGIRFALATLSPYNISTNGIEIVVTNGDGYEENSNYGSGIDFSCAKYSAAGGLNAWDPTSYLNVWVINPLRNNQQSGYVGLTTTINSVNEGVPIGELGIVLHYGAFGVKSSQHYYSLPRKNLGHMLTHEVGHLWGLWHIWGDADSCSGLGGDDIDDTPPQFKPTIVCLNYPQYDICSPAGMGIMFINYMDYTDDRCLLMFTSGQITKMQEEILHTREYYSLTQHPELTGETFQPLTDGYKIVPNPSDGIICIFFERQHDDIEFLYITDLLGRRLATQKYEHHKKSYFFDLANCKNGLYFLHLSSKTHTSAKKILLNK